MTIVRIGLAETKGFDQGYDAIFGKKKPKKPAKKATRPRATKKSKKR